jgi:hypothetical protein
MKKTLLFVIIVAFILISSLNSFAVMIPKVYVDAPYYVDAGEEFYINVEVRVDDVNRIDEVYVEGITKPYTYKVTVASLDILTQTFGPFSIEKNTTFRVIVKYDNGMGQITKNVTVKVKR